MTTAALDSLTVKLTALVTAQKSHPWTTPALAAKLDSAQAAVAGIAATTKLATSSSSAPAPVAKTDALSLGVGVSSATAASLKAGVSLGVGFSASTSIAASFTASLTAAIGLVAGLERELGALNTSSAAIAGPNGVMPPGRSADSAGVDAALRSLTSKLTEAQRQAAAQAPPAEVSPLTAEIRMSRLGAWQAELATDDETALTGKISFTIDEQTFVGTVLPSNTGIDGSRARCRVVAGNGRHEATITGKSYTGGAGVRVGAVLRDILHDCGEDLSGLSDGPTLDRYLPRWHVSSGPANHALTDLAESVGCSWRFLRDGTVWFGPETWPEVTPDHRVVDEDWSAGALMLAPDTPDMVPGVVFQGTRIEHVIHHLGEHLRTEVRSSSPATALKKFLGGQQRQVDYSREWPCKVVTQNPDGTLQLLPDDDVMKARGLDHVPIRYGMPGFTAQVSSGARCHLAFAAGDPARPFAHNWEPESAKLVKLVFVGGLQSLSRVGDLVQSGGPGTVVTLMPLTGAGAPPNNAVVAGLPHLISFSAIPPTPAEAAPLFGAIASGIPKLQG